MCEHGYLNEPSEEELIYKVEGYPGRVFINELLKDGIDRELISGALVREYLNPK